MVQKQNQITNTYISSSHNTLVLLVVFCIFVYCGIWWDLILCGETQILVLIENNNYMTLYIEQHKNK
jgi:hypothetical protein